MKGWRWFNAGGGRGIHVVLLRSRGYLIRVPQLSLSLPLRQADKDILEHIVYDFGDTAMMEALRPSIEEAFPIQSQVHHFVYSMPWNACMPSLI